jgi:hypothetical protein
MMMFIDFKKLSLYKTDKSKQGIYITCDKSQTWYVLFKLSANPMVEEYKTIVDATKFIVATKKDLAVKKAFNRPVVFEL